MRGFCVVMFMGVCLALQTPGYAQEASLSGTITDVTGGVLPGVTVQAVHLASGNNFETVTDAAGTYRISLRIGSYRIIATLPGFQTVNKTGLEVLVGQQATVNLQMAPSSLQETVTVTGESPLVEVGVSKLGGNIDARQVSELPVNGRNWLDLTMLAPGSRTNAVSSDDVVPGGIANAQLNLDGQQVTNTIASGGFGQPHFSRDSIAEFEFISSRFDATQGRSAGAQVNAVTKSGTNVFGGTASGYFRNDSLIGKDFVAQRVLPYSDQQLSATFGGPVVLNKMHFFGNFEYEREPQTYIFNTPYPTFNTDVTGVRTEKKGGGRFDAQLSSQTRFSARGTFFRNFTPYDPRYTGGPTFTLSGSESFAQSSQQYLGSITHVINNNSLNELKLGYQNYGWIEIPTASWSNHPAGAERGAPQITFRGFSLGQRHNNTPQDTKQQNYSVRNDFTTAFGTGGRHTIKAGGEYLRTFVNYFVCQNCMGSIDAQAGPIPANLEALFPKILDASTWNLTPLSPIVRTYSIGIGNFHQHSVRDVSAFWFQDDWAVGSRLTLNLGIRYDLSLGIFAEDVAIEPVVPADRPTDFNNIGPRLGFTYSLTDRMVIRGGYGRYFADISDQVSSWTIRYAGGQIIAQVPNDGRADFASNPFNGPIPTYERALTLPGVTRSLSQVASPNLQIPYSHQTSIGMQRQLAESMSIEADYLYTGGRHGLQNVPVNLTYNPATGVNYPFQDVSRRPFPGFGTVSAYQSVGLTNYHALVTAFNKRFSNRWQASGTYTLSKSFDEDPLPFSGLAQVTFPVAPDLGGEYSLSSGDQRHRGVFNGIWQVGRGFQLSGLYFYGSGQRFGTSYGGDLRQTGGSGGRLRPNGTIVPRNNFVGEPIHRVDIRAQRLFELAGSAKIEGIVEVFNLFNHPNYGSYTTQEQVASYGQPSQNANVAYQPRMAQVGFRLSF